MTIETPGESSKSSSTDSKDASDKNAVPKKAAEKRKDDWEFEYTNSQSAGTYVMKGLRLASRLSVHAYKLEDDDKNGRMELVVGQYIDIVSENFKSLVSASSGDSPVTSWSSFLLKTSSLQKLFRESIIAKVAPEIAKTSSEKGSGSKDDKSKSPQNSSNHASNPAYVDPLRIGAPRMPMRYEYEEDYGSYESGEAPQFGHYGDSDLFGAAGRYGQGMGGLGGGNPGFRGGGSAGGSSVGPNHPGFGDINDPYRGGGDFGGLPPGAPPGAGPYAHPPPRGAKFDPFGPPINPATRPPNKSNHPDGPPGFDNWYS